MAVRPMLSLFRPPVTTEQHLRNGRARLLMGLFGLCLFGLPMAYVNLYAPGSHGWPMAFAAAGVFLCPMFAVIIAAESILARWSQRALKDGSTRTLAFSPARHFLRGLASYLISAAGLLVLAVGLDWIWKHLR